MKRKNFLLLGVLTFALLIFFSFRLAHTPDGINLDEASYGYNGILLAQNMRDQHGRFLPAFILGSDNATWYAPYMQYLVAIMFKLFGPSIFMMRFASVLITVFSVLLTFYLGKLMFAKKYSWLPLVAFVLIPEVMIETHTPLEHMIVVPFVLLWLIGLFLYKQQQKLQYLVLAALSLGIGFYSYAGIRPFVAVWGIASIFYILYLTKNTKRAIAPLTTFIITGLPFVLIIPLLEHFYAGAVFNRIVLKSDSIYHFFYYYLASFDVSFLFIKGDKLQIQSTLRHGMFLLTTLPVFAVGIYQTFQKKDSFLRFLGIVFFVTPILYGFVSSEYFAHRLLYMVPFYTIFVTLGVQSVMENKNQIIKYAGIAMGILILINFYDFWRYYMFDYPKDTAHLFHHMQPFQKPYKILKQEAESKNLVPFISSKITPADGINNYDVELFARAMYFPRPHILNEKDQLPGNAILLSEKADIEGLKRLNVDAKPYYLFVK